MKKVLFISMLFASLFTFQTLRAQSEAQVPGLTADDVWPVVQQVLKTAGTGIASFDQGGGTLVTAPKEYSTMMAKFRAAVVFSYANDVLTIGMKNKESYTTSGWQSTILPSKKADDKLVGDFADAIKALAADPAKLAQLKEKATPAAATAAKSTVKSDVGVPSGGLKIGPKKPSTAGAVEVRFDDEDNYTFSEGLCALKKNEMWGFIDTTGKVVIDYTFFKWANKTPEFSSGIALVAVPDPKTSGRAPVYIDKKGQSLFKPQKFTNATPFQSGIAIVEKTNETNRMRTYLFINKQGQPLAGAINPGAGRGWSLELKPFKDGLSPMYDNKTSAIGFINPQGKWAVQPTAYNESGDFGNGLVAVQNKVNWYWGFINKKGEVAIPFDYKNKPGNFSDGLVAVKNSQDQYGYIDINGKTVLPFVYGDLCYPFVQGFAVAYVQDNKPGYSIIDKSGTVIRRFGPDPVVVYDNGWIYYKEWIDNFWAVGISSHDGKDILVPGYFNYIGEFRNGLAYAVATIDHKQVRGFINLNFDFVILQTY